MCVRQRELLGTPQEFPTFSGVVRALLSSFRACRPHASTGLYIPHDPDCRYCILHPVLHLHTASTERTSVRLDPNTNVQGQCKYHLSLPLERRELGTRDTRRRPRVPRAPEPARPDPHLPGPQALRVQLTRPRCALPKGPSPRAGFPFAPGSLAPPPAAMARSPSSTRHVGATGGKGHPDGREEHRAHHDEERQEDR